MQKPDLYPLMLLILPMGSYVTCYTIDLALWGEPLKSTAAATLTAVGLGIYMGILIGMTLEGYRKSKYVGEDEQ